nr:UDP-N-acetylmuramoyl-tripeptide--D-alanyl-D-alanine ligase [Streptomyces sp. SID3343]
MAKALGGRLAGDADPNARITGEVVVDSREAGPGALFAALRGTRVDGHDHARDAITAGAVAVLADHETGAPSVLVEDVVASLGRLARRTSDRLTDTTVIAVTGSSGEAGVEDLLARVLGTLGPTIASTGDVDDAIGLPLTALRADENTRHLVVGTTARGIGDIAHLCDVTPPTIGVVLAVGGARGGEFGGRDDIAAERELVEALPADGVAVLNADDARVRALASRTKARVVTFGESGYADVRAENVTLDDRARASFTLRTPEGSAPVILRLYGEHHVANALACAAVAREVGMTVEDLAAALGAADTLSRRHMEVTCREDGVTVVNDAYDADPESMRAALKALVAMAGGGKRTFAVLGGMREPGEASLTEHDAIGRLAVRLNIHRLVAVGGREAAWIDMGAKNEGSWGEESVLVPDVEAAVEILRGELAPGDVVLVKASRGVALERVADALLADTQVPDGAKNAEVHG